MFKKEGWPEFLNDYLNSVRTKPFGPWGRYDCCLFTADGGIAMTGEDFAADFRGKYDDPASAYAALQDFAGGGILPTMEKLALQHGLAPVAPLRAQRGDFVLLPPSFCGGDARFDGALALCAGPLSFYLDATKGLRATSTVPNAGQPGITHAWRIPLRRD